MTENRFFIWLWRFNAIMIAVAALLIVSLLLWELTRNWRQAQFPTTARDVVTVTPDNGAEPAAVERVTRLGRLFSEQGDLYVFGVFQDQTYRNRGISKSSTGNLINYLIVDGPEGRNWQLFGPQDRIIRETMRLSIRGEDGNPLTIGHVLLVIETDSNGDARLSETDPGRLLLVFPGWAESVVLAEGVTGLTHAGAPRADVFDVVYATPEGDVAARFRSTDGTRINLQQLER